MTINSIDDVKSLFNQWKSNQSVHINFFDVVQSVKYLTDSTKEGGDTDPFKEIEKSFFYEFSTFFHKIGFFDMGIYSMNAFYNRCLELQGKTKRINKEIILHWIGRYNYQIGDLELGFKYYLISFIEEVITKYKIGGKINEDELIGSSSKDLMLLYFKVPESILLNIQKETVLLLDKNKTSDLYPEVIFTKLQSSKINIPRFMDYKRYNPIIPYLKDLFNNINRSKDHKKWEQFAAELFSSIEGFEPLSDISVGNGSYQFDLIIRNIANKESFFRILGDYIPIECKYFGKDSVNVENLNHFASKIKYHNFKCGIIFSKTPISGWKIEDTDARFGRLIQIKLFNRDNIIIFDINSDDIEKVLNRYNLIDLLIEKYENIRLES